MVIPRPGFQSGGIQAPLAAQSHEGNRSGREHNPGAVPYGGPTQHAFWQTQFQYIQCVHRGHLRTFPSPPREMCTLADPSSPPALPTDRGDQQLLSPRVDLYFLHSPYTWNHTECGSFPSGCFQKRHVLWDRGCHVVVGVRILWWMTARRRALPSAGCVLWPHPDPPEAPPHTHASCPPAALGTVGSSLRQPEWPGSGALGVCSGLACWVLLEARLTPSAPSVTAAGGTGTGRVPGPAEQEDRRAAV